MMYQIQDWTGRIMQYSDSNNEFETFDDAEGFLSEFLGDNYDTDRQEYEIVEVSNEA
jgi:hypothetical protein